MTNFVTDQTLKTVQDDLSEYKNKYDDTHNTLEAARQTIAELEEQVATCTSELSRLQESCKHLEDNTAEFRRQRDLVVDERDNLLKMLDRRNIEIERLNSDITSLTKQLNAAVNAKCEAIAKQDEVASMKLTLDFKEKHLEQERTFLTDQIKSLNEIINDNVAEIQNVRCEHTRKVVMVESRLAQKTEELNIANRNIASLSSQNKILAAKAEELNEKLRKEREVEIHLKDSFHQELQAQIRLVELYKGMSEEGKNKQDELKKAFEELQALLRSTTDQYGELETKYRDAEMEHDEILCKKNECIVLLKKELDAANEILKQVKENDLRNEIDSISPSFSAASRLSQTGMSFSQMYTKVNSMNDELIQERAENRRLNNYIAKILQDFEDKAPLLQKERQEYEGVIEQIMDIKKERELILEENQRLIEEYNEAKKIEGQQYRENQRLKKDVADLSRQVRLIFSSFIKP